MTIDPAALALRHTGGLLERMGVRFTEAATDSMVADLEIRDDRKTVIQTQLLLRRRSRLSAPGTWATASP